MRERPSARTPLRVRGPRAFKEFVAVPVLVAAGLLLLAVASIVGDQAHGAVLTSARRGLNHVIGRQAASNTLSAVASGLVTVTSITFSVLLLAVQQTASSLSPVVFDQFVRRRSNQVYLGLFVGLALYAYVVMAAVQPNTPPIIGAFLATVLTVAALGCLLVLVYSTIDQMRPDNVMRQLHDRAVRAHEREERLLARTRRSSASSLPVKAEYRCETFGYVEALDVDRIAAALAGDEGAEVEICRPVGAEVGVGDVIARVRHQDAAAAERVRHAVVDAVPISRTPDLDFDPSTAIRDISNIGWTSGSTSKHNPAIAGQALHALRDIAARWLLAGPDAPDDPLAIVYPDEDLDTVLDAMYSALVVAQESRQHQQAVRVLESYLFLLPLAEVAVRDRLLRDLAASGPILDALPPSPMLDRVRRRVSQALDAQQSHVGGRRTSFLNGHAN